MGEPCGGFSCDTTTPSSLPFHVTLFASIGSMPGEEVVSAVHVIGDVHGQLAKLRDLLRGAELIRKDETWSGGDISLWLMGDLVNHGPDGIGVVELVMRLQQEAAGAGGHVQV